MTVIEMPVDSLRETDFIKEMVRQMRALDSYGQFDGQPAERLLDPFVLTKERKAAIPLIGDPDETTVAYAKSKGLKPVFLEECCSLLGMSPIAH